MREIYIQANGVLVRAHEWGDLKNPMVICIHGLGSTSLSFIEIGSLLKHKYRLISIDLPGHGKTFGFSNEEGYYMPNMVKWLDAVISNITKNKFYILAHSWGADIALHYLAENSSKVIKALLLDGGYYIRSDLYSYEKARGGKIDSLQKEIDYYTKDFDEYCFDTMKEHIETEKSNYTRWSHLLEKASEDLVRIDGGKYRYHAKGSTAEGAIKSMYYYPPESIYSKLPNSIYLLQSTLPESMEGIRKLMVSKFKEATGAVVRRIEVAGHLIHWDKPNEVVEEVLDWFDN